MSSMKSLVATTLVVLLVAGCGLKKDDDKGDAAEFREAVPTASQLALTPFGEGSEDGQALVGQKAVLALLTTLVALDVNLRVGIGLGLVKLITLLPPSELTLTSATWGPWQGSDTPLHFKLTVSRGSAPKNYIWKLLASEEGSTWEEVVTGSSTKGVSATFSGYTGTFSVDATTLNRMDESKYKSTGTVNGDYDTTGDERNLTVEFIDFVKEPGKAKINATYVYLDREDRSGEFSFTATQDMQADGSAEEDYQIMTEWNETREGRSEATVTGGDLDPGTSVDLIECWDDQLKRTYWKNTAPTALVPEEGDASACVF